MPGSADVAVTDERRVGYGHTARARSGDQYTAVDDLLLSASVFGFDTHISLGAPELIKDEAARKIVEQKHLYLNTSFFWIRAGIYFLSGAG